MRVAQMCSLPVPPRKTERQTRVSRNSSKYRLKVVLMLKPSRTQRTNLFRAIDDQFALVTQRHPAAREAASEQGPRFFRPVFCRRLKTANLLPWQGQAMMPRSGFHAVRHPRCVHTAFNAKNPSCAVNDKNAGVDIQRDRIELIALRLAHVDHRRWLVQNIR